MMHRNRGFWLAGLFASALAAAVYWLRLAWWFPFLDRLLNKEGAPGWIALVVFWFIAWVLLAVVGRAFGALAERNTTAMVKGVVDGLDEYELTDGDVDRSVGEAIRHGGGELGRLHENAYLNSRFRQRLLLLGGRMGDHNRAERAASLLAGQSELDAARLKTSYGMLNALVWAMPGLGFMGTAFEMSRAVRGMGASLARSDGGQSNEVEALKDVLVREVIPFLGDAFNITLFALGGSVLCFLLIALVHQQEEGVLIDSDDVALALVSRLGDDGPQALPPPPAPDRPEEIEKVIRELHSALVISGAELSKLNEFIGRSGSALRAIFSQRGSP